MRRLRILLADDHETVREGLKTILTAQEDMEVVGEAADGNAAVAQAVALSPDIVILDVSMPALNGLKATEQIRSQCPAAVVLALTRHSSDGYLHQLLRAGAAGYVLKQSRSATLLHAIRAVATGGTYLDPAVAGRAIAHRHRPAPATAVGIADPGLSEREEEVLRLAAWGYSNKDMAAQLDLSVKTIETHKANATQKLGLRHRIDIVRYALWQGWLKEDV
jgi:two-component system, NarL family, response regulator NreC